MSYITLQQLAEKPGATELAQVAAAEHGPVVDATLFDLTLRDGDRSAYDAEAIAAADAARARIEEIVAEVDATIDAHVVRRVAAVPVQPAPKILTRIARSFVRYELHKDLVADGKHSIVRDYQDKRALLEAIRDGRVTLGIDDPAAAGQADAGPQYDAPCRVFDTTTLADY